MNNQTITRLFIALILCLVAYLPKTFAQHDFRALTPVEAAYFKKVNEVIKKAIPSHAGALPLINSDVPGTDTKSKTMLADHPVNKGDYTLFYSFEFGKTIDDIRLQSKLDAKIQQAVNDNDEAKERELLEKLAKLVAEQRCYIDISVNFGLLNFNYAKGPIQALAVKDAVAYRCLFAEDLMSNVPYVVGTYVGIGMYETPKDAPYEGAEGGVFEVIAKKNESFPDMSIQDVQIKIQAAPAIADQLIKQIDIAALKKILGKKLQ